MTLVAPASRYVVSDISHFPLWPKSGSFMSGEGQDISLKCYIVERKNSKKLVFFISF